MSQFLKQILALIQSSLSRAPKQSPLLLLHFSTRIWPNIPVLEDADTEGNEENIETVLEEAEEDFFPQHYHCIENEDSQNVLPNVEKLMKSLALCKLTLLHLATPFWAQRDLQNPAKNSLFMNR